MNSAGKVAMAMADHQCRQALSEYFEFQGHEVQVAETAQCLVQMTHEWLPDVVVCEHRLPALDAIAVCHALRAVSLIPIVVLLRQEGELRAAQALDAGADACVSLPCDPDDLLSQIRAVLRRAPSRHAERPPLEIGDFCVLEDTRRCLIAGQEVRLRSQSFTLLHYMLRSGKRVFTHAELSAILWGPEHTGSVEFLRPLIMELRKMIEPDWHHPCYLLTEYRVGYRFNPFRKQGLTQALRAGSPGVAPRRSPA